MQVGAQQQCSEYTGEQNQRRYGCQQEHAVYSLMTQYDLIQMYVCMRYQHHACCKAILAGPALESLLLTTTCRSCRQWACSSTEPSQLEGPRLDALPQDSLMVFSKECGHQTEMHCSNWHAEIVTMQMVLGD